MKLTITEQILQLADGKRSLAALACEIGTTERYIRSFLCRIRRFDLIPPSPAPTVDRRVNPWRIPGVVEDLRDLHSSGLTNSVIAKQLNDKYGTTFSRNAVIGRAKRIGMPARIQAQESIQRRARAQKRIKPSSPAAAVLAPEPFVPIADLPPLVARKSLLELGEWDCRFPVGDPLKPGFGFCGQERVPCKPYCPDCCRRAFVSVPVRQRSPERERETA